MFQCIVPFWGMRRFKEIERITFSEEMAPWTLGTAYDRPVARRIVEEAGVPRGAFAVRKKNTSHEAAFRWPYSPAAQESFRDYLKRRGLWAPRRLSVGLLRRAAHAESLVYANVCDKLGLRRRFRPWLRLGGAGLLFQWANDSLKTQYRAALEQLPGGDADAH
jgi:hypothetical protein